LHWVYYRIFRCSSNTFIGVKVTGLDEVDVIKGGSKALENVLPNVDIATINANKLTEYALNPEHPVGGIRQKFLKVH